MKRALLAFILLALPLAAQQATKPAQTVPSEPQAQKLFLLKYADPFNVSQLLRVFHVDIVQDTTMRAIAVSAPKETLSAIEEVIQKLDVPSAAATNVELM